MFNMKRFGILLLSLLMALTVMMALASCAGTDTMTGATPPPEDVQSSYADTQVSGGGEDVLRVAAGRNFFQGSSSNIFVHFSTNIWEALVLFDDDMEPEMWLAKSIESSDDGLVWTITLNEGIVFHDGSALTADVAAFNLERLFRWNPATASIDPDFARPGEFGNIVDFDVVSEYVFTVTHAEPIPDFTSRLAMSNSAMFAMASFDADGAITNPYGTGAFLFSSYDEVSQIIRLERFEQYHRGLAAVETVYFLNIPDPVTRLAALQSGEIDVIADVGGVMPQQAAAIELNENLVLKYRQVSTVHYLGINSNEGALFSDARLRTAVSLSVDRESIVDILLLGYGAAAISVLTDLSTDWVIDGHYSFSNIGADMIAEAATGGVIPDAVFLLNSAWTGRWPYADVAAMLQSELAEAGIRLSIETVDNATWNERVRNSDYDIIIHPATVTSGEPTNFFQRFLHSGGADNITRGHGISNPEIDALIERASTELDRSTRISIARELQTIVSRENYIIPIWYDVTLYAMNTRVQNFGLDVQFRPDLFLVELS